MTRTAEKLEMSYADYVAFEATSETKHEWLRGEVFAMAGGIPEHAALAGRLMYELQAAVIDRPCEVYSSDLRVKVQETGLATYPDISVVCTKLERAPDDPHAAVNPIVLVEVLSDSTEAYDRGEKFAHYRRIPSLREYVLVSHREKRIEVHRLNEAGHWELHEATLGGSVEISSIGCRLSADTLFRERLAAS
jgi:Uma2 family endonuclease